MFCVCAPVCLGLNQARRVDSRSDQRKVCRSDYGVAQDGAQRADGSPRSLIRTPGQQRQAHAATSGGGPETAAAPRIPLNFIAQKQAVQTLIQPDAPARSYDSSGGPASPDCAYGAPPELAVKQDCASRAPRPVAEVKVQPTLEATESGGARSRPQNLGQPLRHESSTTCTEQNFASQREAPAAVAADAGDSVEERRTAQRRQA